MQHLLTLFDPALVKPAHRCRVRKLDPRVQWRNPVMFVVYVGSILTTLLWRRLGGQGEARGLHPRHGAVAVVHGAVRQLRRGHGRRPQQGAGGVAARLKRKTMGQGADGQQPARAWLMPWHPQEADELRKGDVVLVEAGDVIPPTARSSKAWPRSTKAPSPASRRP
jgi:K+-transporting ATPase ATPase B chain